MNETGMVQTGTDAKPGGFGSAAARFLKEQAIIVIFGGLFVALALSSPVFLKPVNLFNIGDQWAPLTIIACGMTVVLITGAFDLSVGAIYALAGVGAALAANATGDPTLGVLVGVLVGGVCGLVNGLLVAYGRVNAFIVTLATGLIISGVSLWITQGRLISVAAEGYEFLGRGKLLTVPVSIWVLVVVAILFSILLSATTFGRYVYATGGNRSASKMAGVPVNLVTLVAFVLTGLASGLAGVIASSQVGNAQAAGSGSAGALPLLAIAGAVLGGTSLFGGSGAIWRTLLGVGVLALIGNAFNLLRVDSTIQQIVQGVIVLVAVGIDAWTRTHRRT